MTEYYRFQTGNNPSLTFRGYAVSPHLIAHHLTTSSFYAILSRSGKAMFVDYGSASGAHFGNFERATDTTDRIRFVEHNIDDLKSRFGMKSIDVVMPSHMHDDHVNGFPHLMRKYNAKVWCYENMVDIFENPRGQNLGCILGEPFKVARTFKDGDRFQWEEYEFEITHSPGHTEYQMALFVTIDGARVAFTGDAFFAFADPNQGMLRHNVIFRNHVESDSHLKSIRNLIAHEPNIIAPGHGKPFLVTREEMLATEQKFRRQEQYLPGAHCGPGHQLRARPELVQPLPVSDGADTGQHGPDADPRPELPTRPHETRGRPDCARRVGDRTGSPPLRSARELDRDANVRHTGAP